MLVFLTKIYRSLDNCNEHIGKAASALTLFMVLVQFFIVAQRYILGEGSIWLQESIVYMHGTLIMLAVGYTYLHQGHVRVDIFYQILSQRGQDWVNLLGSVFFALPLSWLIFYTAYPVVELSWQNLEGSTETSGIPYKYLLKSTMLLFALLLASQAISNIIKAGLRLKGYDVYDPHLQEVSLD